MTLMMLVFFPMAAALLCLWAGRRRETLRDGLAIGAAAAEFLLACRIAAAGNGTAVLPGLCSLGLRLELDGFRKVYAVVIGLMWLMTMMLSPQYFRHHGNRNRYYFFNLMTLGATMGVFLAADLYTAFVFFEIMSFTSFTWVIQEETPGAIRAGETYLAVAVIGGLAALMGLFLVQHELGTTEVSKLYALARNCPHKGTLYAAGGCILLGFGAKAGMFPLHIWLPKAHPVAPAPASALLSGVLTKSGVWGILAISCNLFREDPAWGTLILTLGTVTMVLGAVLATFSMDLKRTLACSSMSQIGFVLVGVGMMGLLGEENALAARGTLLHMVNHSLFKLVLFECAGVVYMNLHALDLNEIRGFGRKKPLLMGTFLLGAMGIGGIPLLNGYVSKTLLHESIVEGAVLYGGILKVVEWLFLISGGMTLAYMTKLFVCLFVEKNPTRQAEYDGKKGYMNLLSGAAVLIPAVILPVLGLTANVTMNGIADVGTDFFHCGEPEHAVHYLSPENLKGAVISILIGAGIYLLVVRKWMRKDGNYVNRWPEKLDLEDRVYRPLVTRWLPGVFGWVSAIFGENRVLTPAAKAVMDAAGSIGRLFGENRVLAPVCGAVLRVSGIAGRVFCDLPDALVYVLGRTVYRKSRLPDDDKVTSSLSYRIGKEADKAAIRLGREKKGGRHYAHLLYRSVDTLQKTTNRIMGNVSFALLMLCGAVCLVFVYILVLHG